LVYGYEVTITGDYIAQLSMDDTGTATDTFVVDLYRRFTDDWQWVSENTTPIVSTGLAPLDSGAIDSYGDLIIVIGRDSNGAQPQQSSILIYRIIPSNQLSLLQTISLPSTSEQPVDVCVFDDYFVAVSNDAYYYELTGLDTWTLNQTINGTSVYTKCSIWDFGLVLSYERDPTGDSYETYTFSSNTWNLIDTGTTDSIDGNWKSVIISINGQNALSSIPFMVFSSALGVPISLIDINTASGTNFQENKFISSTGTGVINAYERNTIIADTLIVNGQNALNFQNRFDGFSVTQNDLWQDDVVMLVDLGTNFTVYANFCPR